jgi:DNA topoisomerase-3
MRGSTPAFLPLAVLLAVSLSHVLHSKFMASTSTAVLAEKPSVARDIARVLGAGSHGEGYLHGNGYIVTWAIGHLAALAQPHEIEPQWRQWSRQTLPMLPKKWPLVVQENTKDQFEIVQKILNSPRVSQIVCATDAGREGELIFRYIYEAAQCDKPFRRLWISSLTPDSIRKGFDSLRPGSDYDALADAARGRSRADWLVGMNLSRAYSLAFGDNLSVGRVQTPTLAMLVERELAIRNFVPEDYLEVVATFHPAGKPPEHSYQGTWVRDRITKDDAEKESLAQSMRLPPDGEEANRIVGRARTGQAAIESIEAQTQRMAPPQLYDLTELQRHANRLYGFSAQRTLDAAQALYERYKLLSYPRTDSRHLSQDVAGTLPAIVKAIEAPYREHLAPATGERSLGRRFVDDAKVSDHHAIIPTTMSPANVQLTPDERKIYDLVCRRLLSAWHEDHVWSVTTVITAIRNGEIADRYHTSGSTVQNEGWKVLDIALPNENREKALPSELEPGQPQDVLDAEVLAKKTRGPRRFTEATLLTAMETAGKTLDEKELSDAMKETGLGTPATRASIIELLLKREYIVRKSKTLEATDKGIHLIGVVHPEVKSPAMTGQWEAYLRRIHRGAAQLDPFLKGIEDYVTEVVGKVGALPVPPRSPQPPNHSPGPNSPSPPAEVQRPAPNTPLADLLQAFGFTAFRANQESVCQAVIEGRDVLLVMPTGSGKSLCYQLPALARGGTALIVSPLIALMEDQAAKLGARQFAVACIHSGRDRAASRQACIDYLSGSLEFLFIAPERLRVSGFPEMLTKRKPSLIAIDEAHCISQWGHDFRPDYRMLGQYLPSLRPAPVIALTATATPIVQDDIAVQLGLAAPARFIHGFRRENLAIEVVEVAPSERAALAMQLLLDEARRPAIVYTPTRAQATSLAADLNERFPSAAYHAGLDTSHRKSVQERFVAGQIEVMVATIAFGMGIDKPDVRTVIHTALPGSLEAFYQEIGRAGRDGLPSRTILMQSYADRRTHDFFFERDYPDAGVLQSIYERLSAQPMAKGDLRRQIRMAEDAFDRALEKLWIHGGVQVDYAENVSRGHDHWRDSYIAQFDQKQRQLDLMLRYADSNQCRMAAIVRHFGDLVNSENPCGVCDFCAPAASIGQRFREATVEERELARRILGALHEAGVQPTGKLYSGLLPNGDFTRDEFEEVLGALARSGLLRLTDASFEKDGKTIPFRKAAVTRHGHDLEDAAELEFRMKSGPATLPKSGRKQKSRQTKAEKERAATGPRKAASKPAGVRPPARAGHVPVSTDSGVEDALRAWRLAEAKRRGVPAFRILNDQTLKALAANRPATATELLAIPGIGISTVEKYGAQLYRLLHESR